MNMGFGSSQGYGGSGGAASGGLFEVVPDWWGPELRYPNSTGAQNGIRYAIFGQARRLAVEQGGRVTVYDTLDHQIGGVSQQQSGSATLNFSSQYGQVDVGSLPVVSIDGVAPSPAPSSYAPPPSVNYGGSGGYAGNSGNGGNSGGGSGNGGDIFGTIERLAELHARGVLSVDEFQQKKAELLSRL